MPVTFTTPVAKEKVSTAASEALQEPTGIATEKPDDPGTIKVAFNITGGKNR